MHTPHRERRPWTPQEDELLRAAVSIEEPGNPNPSKWFAIAQRVPGRTNKDCRKRWFAKMTSNIVKGIWSPEEDQKLLEAIEKHGTRWSIVASCVHTRNSDQCAKRWTDTLDPSIVRTIWTPEDDQILIDAVSDHGTAWTKIVRLYFPGRTGLSAKNRYASLMRSHHLHQRTRPPSRSSRGSGSVPPPGSTRGPLNRRQQSQSSSIASQLEARSGRSNRSESSESDLPLDLISFPQYSTLTSSSHSPHSHSSTGVAAGAAFGSLDPSDEELLALLSPPMTRTDHSAQTQAFAGSVMERMVSTSANSNSNKTTPAAYSYTNGQPHTTAISISPDSHHQRHHHHHHSHSHSVQHQQYNPPQSSLPPSQSSHHYYDRNANAYSQATRSSQIQMDMTDMARIKHEIPEIQAQVLRHADEYWAQWR